MRSARAPNDWASGQRKWRICSDMMVMVNAIALEKNSSLIPNIWVTSGMLCLPPDAT